MNNIRRIASVVTAAVVLSFCFHAAAAGQQTPQKIDGIYQLTLQGTPYEIGFQQGTIYKEQIQQVYSGYLKEMIYNKWMKEYAILKGGKMGKDAYSNPRKAMTAFAKSVEKNIPLEYLQEMHGLADGAGLDFTDVLNMSAHVDYFAILCSTLVASGPATPDGKLVEARNLDWAQGGLKDLDELSAVIVYKPQKGHSFVSVLYPGLVGVLTAVNDAQITAELNFSMAKENGKEGIPSLILMRQVIQYAGTLDEAEEIIRSMPLFAGYNITVTDGKTNDARLIEVSAKGVGVMNLQNNTLVSTNHFVTKELAGGNVEASQFSSSPSGDRYNRLVDLMKQNYGKIDMDKSISMIHDDIIKVPGTVQTIVFKPADRQMWVWTRNRKPGDFIKFDVSKLLGPSAGN